MISIRRHARNWGAHLAGGGLVLTLALWWLRRQHENPSPDDNSRVQEHREHVDQPVRREAPSHSLRHYNHPSEEEHRTAEQFNWRYSFRLNVCIVIVAVVGAVFAFGSFIESRRLAIDTHRTLIASERPYLHIVGDVLTRRDVLYADFEYALDTINTGNSTATEITINSKLLSLNINAPNVDYKNIRCGIENSVFVNVIQQPKVILQGSTERLGFYIDAGGKALRSFAPRINQPYLIGCIQYRWLTGDDYFRTYFQVRVKLIDRITGSELQGNSRILFETSDQNIGLSFKGQKLEYLGVN